MSEIAAARRKLIDAGHILEHQGHGDMTRGHVSVRVPGRPDHFFVANADVLRICGTLLALRPVFSKLDTQLWFAAIGS